MPPETQYARSGDIHIAYQVTGDGPIDLVYVPGWVSHLEHAWEYPPYARCLHRLGSFARLIRLDKRGTGLSDRVPVSELPMLEQRMYDVRAVMDAVGSERAVLFGVAEGSLMCTLFAATYPERSVALALYASLAKSSSAPDYPRGMFSADPAEREQFYERVARGWGKPDTIPLAPTADRRHQEWWAAYQRFSASPGAAIALLRMNAQIDVRNALSAIRVPTLVVNRIDDPVCPIWGARYVAEHIPDARLVELAGVDHPFWVGDSDAVMDEIEEFVTGARPGAEPDRVLATVLFTDIVGSTEHAAALGDRRWRALLDDHHSAVRRELARFRGREVHTAGNGFLATFDGPARAARCAVAITQVVRALGLEVRAGVHTGELELMGDDIGGIAVHTGARVAAEAGPGEVFVRVRQSTSSRVGLVAGESGTSGERGRRV
jgi:pimeloyl-ACP methyl ester carboxylesterase